ncbi:MAG TPA: response regulator transcription factor [Thermoanaerobaculia bacterium]|nr:response regulator transcription factor [Thermoanaerobaculia bacterium]
MINLIIADDHQAIRYGVKSMLASHPDFVVAGEAASGAELLEQVRTREADSILLDIALDDTNGLDLIKEFKAVRASIRVLVFTSSYASVERALSLGADGYLTKDSHSGELIEALRTIAGGKRYLGRNIAERLGAAVTPSSPPAQSLTPREREIMMSIIRGKRIKEIAAGLDISDKTVATHRARLLKKLNLSDNRELFQYALRHGLADWS